MHQRNLLQYIIISLKGMAMGAADVVPGVSGGTIAFISGIYEELLGSISAVNLTTLKLLKTDGIKAAWKAVNGNFLLALFIGIFTSILSLAKLISWLLENKPIDNLHTHSYGFHTANGRSLIKGMQNAYWEELQFYVD